VVTRYAIAGLLLAYVIVIARSSAIGLGDTSNHLARAYVMADLIFHHGVHFGAQFEYHFQAVPYVLPDLLLAAAVEVLGPRIAVASWTVLIFMAIPAALLLYFRVNLGTKGKALLEDEGALFLLLCATYLSTDFFFVAGFFAFQLGFACSIVIFTLIELLRRRWSNALFALYCGLVVAAYLIHLSTLVFLATIVAVSGVLRLWFRASSGRHELFLFAPIVVMLAWHFGVATHYRRLTDISEDVYYWGNLPDKMQRTARAFLRYGGRPDQFLRYLYEASLLMLIASRAWRDAFASRAFIESLALATAFFGMYFILPFYFKDGAWVDVRALAPATVFILLACLHLPRREPLRSFHRAPSLVVVLAFVLAIGNLAYLDRHFVDLSNWSTKYRALFAAIPRGAHLLPVATDPVHFKFMGPAATAVIDRQVAFPSLFSGDRGHPMTYFRYVDPPYNPPSEWYMKGSPLVDWQQIACTYQYILVTQPFDAQRIRVATKLIAENTSAALLAVDPRACGKP
jgi:hypothetical protein